MRGATPTSIEMSRISCGRAAVGALLVDGDAPADDVLLELVEGVLHGGALGLVRLGVGGLVAGERGQRLRLDGLDRVLALELVDHLGGLVEGGAEAVLDLAEHGLVDLRRRDLDLVLAGLLAQLVLGLAEALDLGVRDVERVEDLGLGDLVRAGLDHQDRVGGAGDDQVERALEQPLLVGVDEEVALGVLADAHGADGLREGDVRHRQRGAGAVHREDVVGVDAVDRHRDRDQLGLASPALGEQRAQRAVDHAGREGGLLARTTLAAEEAAGDLARGVHALFDIHRQRQEVDVALVACGRGARTIVSPAVTTTDPLACLASLPVSKLISVPPISSETRLTS